MIRIFAMKASDQDFSLPRWGKYLSEKRREEALRRKNDGERQLYLAAEALLNRGLEAVDAGIDLPVRYERNEHGKPFLSPANGLYVNWSHSGEYAVCAVSDREVGIDLQRMDREPAVSLVKRTLQPEERRCYEDAPEQERTRLFYRYWTVKESYLKALGTGFSASLDTFYVEMDKEAPKIVQRQAGQSYACRMLAFADDLYAAAVCCEERVERAEIEYF